MAGKVMNGHDGHPPRPRERFREREAYQQRSDQPGSLRDRDRVDGRRPAVGERARRRRRCRGRAASRTAPGPRRPIRDGSRPARRRRWSGSATDASGRRSPRRARRRFRRRRSRCREQSCQLPAGHQLRERFLVRRPRDAALGDDRGDELRRRHVERGLRMRAPSGVRRFGPTCVTSRALRSSIGMCDPSGVSRSMVESGAAT